MISKSVYYQVGEGDELTLKIQIGHGQPGATTICIGGQHLASGEGISKIEKKIPFKGKDLLGKVLTCLTSVKDLINITNQTSVTYSLTGGPNSFEKTINELATVDGEIINYCVDFYFYL